MQGIGKVHPLLVPFEGLPHYRCSPSAQVGQFEAIEEERVFGSSLTAEGAVDEIENRCAVGWAEKAVRDIRRATRRHFSAEDKVRIVIAGPYRAKCAEVAAKGYEGFVLQ